MNKSKRRPRSAKTREQSTCKNGPLHFRSENSFPKTFPSELSWAISRSNNCSQTTFLTGDGIEYIFPSGIYNPKTLSDCKYIVKIFMKHFVSKPLI